MASNTSWNNITGDRLKSKANSKAFEDNYDAIFKKKKPNTQSEEEKRIDIIGQNGNDGEHYGNETPK